MKPSQREFALMLATAIRVSDLKKAAIAKQVGIQGQTLSRYLSPSFKSGPPREDRRRKLEAALGLPDGLFDRDYESALAYLSTEYRGYPPSVSVIKPVYEKDTALPITPVGGMVRESTLPYGTDLMAQLESMMANPAAFARTMRDVDEQEVPDEAICAWLDFFEKKAREAGHPEFKKVLDVYREQYNC